MRVLLNHPLDQIICRLRATAKDDPDPFSGSGANKLILTVKDDRDDITVAALRIRRVDPSDKRGSLTLKRSPV